MLKRVLFDRAYVHLRDKPQVRYSVQSWHVCVETKECTDSQEQGGWVQKVAAL